MHHLPPDLLANQALVLAAQILETRYPDACFAFAAGSIMRGQSTQASDIDLVVIYPGLDRAWRDSFVESGFPIEVFVHDAQTLNTFLARDVEQGRPVMINLVAEGRVVGSRVDGAIALKARARALLAAGPAPLTGERLETLLYQVSDLGDDLRGQRSAEEVTAIAVALYPRLVDLMLLGRGQWTGAGKWMPRRLRMVDAGMADGLQAAMERAAKGDGRALLALGEAELARHGGPVFAGYKRVSDVAGAGSRPTA